MTDLLTGVVGSRAYGIDNPDSDYDRMRVYCAPSDRFLGLRGADVAQRVKSTQEHHPSDTAVHEVGTFLAMCLDCNPAAMEILWLSEWDLLTRPGRLLVSLREDVLHAPGVRGTYGGYVRAQLKRSEQSGLSNKALGHALRLAWQGTDLLQTGRLRVRLPEPIRSHVLDIRAGLTAESDARALIESFSRSLDRTDTVLPDKADRDVVEKSLLTIRAWVYDYTEGTTPRELPRFLPVTRTWTDSPSALR